MPKRPNCRLPFLLALAMALVANGMFLSCVLADNGVDFWETYDPRAAPLNIETVLTHETSHGTVHLVRYDLGRLEGSNKSASPRIAAYLGIPTSASAEAPVPGIIQIHGGGQRANKRRVETWMEMGFACLSINWGGKVLEGADTPNTDWDGLAAGFIRPGIEKEDKLDHWNVVKEGPNTLHATPHLLNSSWNLIALSARRGLTLLESHDEIDGDRLGVAGHSMGGRATVLTAIDPRVKAASPSVGGTGFLYQDLWGLPGSARYMRVGDGLPLYEKTVSAQAYWPRINCPTLFLGASNDFNSPTEFAVKGMSLLPESTPRVLALAPHFNHRFTDETDAARYLWMEAHLKGSLDFPKSSPATLKLDTGANVPLFSVTPPPTPPRPTRRGEKRPPPPPPHPRWHSAEVVQHGEGGDTYSAHLHIFDPGEPLFAFANITYKTGHTVPARPGKKATDRITLASQYLTALPADLQAAGVKATAKRSRVLDDFSRGEDGMIDWYRLNIEHRPHWLYATRKVVDPVYMGPQGAELILNLETFAPANTLAAVATLNNWQRYTGRKTDEYTALVPIPESGRQTLRIAATDFRNNEGQRLRDWDELTEIQFTPGCNLRNKYKIKDTWNGDRPRLHRLTWEGGSDAPRPYPHEPRPEAAPTNAIKATGDFNDTEFTDAIKDSVELENRDAKKE